MQGFGISALLWSVCISVLFDREMITNAEKPNNQGSAITSSHSAVTLIEVYSLLFPGFKHQYTNRFSSSDRHWTKRRG